MTDHPTLPLTLRRHCEADLPFLRRLYADVRRQELAAAQWPEAQLQAFCESQFEAQYRHYQQHYCSDRFDIIELDGEAIGRLFVDAWSTELRIVDISLLSGYRGRGIGSHCFRRLFLEAASSDRTVTIHVERDNPARQLYERLGFGLKTETNEVYLLMEWRPDRTRGKK